jgi:hypothetical protein
MASVGFIYYDNLPILYTNLAGARSEEIISICQKSRQLMQTLPENSVFSLINIQGIHLNNESLLVIKETMRANRAFVKVSALFGLEGLTKTLIQIVTVFSGREVKVFADLEKAKQWLRGKAGLLR